MLANPEAVEKIVILPVCWHSDALNRLSRTVDLDELRRQRKLLQAGIEEDIKALGAACGSSSIQEATGCQVQLDAVARKHLDILLELLQTFAAVMDRLD